VVGEWIYRDSESSEVVVYTGRIATVLELTANTTHAYVGEPVALIARLTMINGTPVAGVSIDFYIYYGDSWAYMESSTTNSTGYAVYVTASSITGTWSYKALYSGSDEYLPAESNVLNITFSKKPVEILVVSIEPEQPYVGDTIEIKLKLVSLGEPVPYARINIYNGTKLLGIVSTNLYGEAVLRIENAPAGVYDLWIAFGGTDVYKSGDLYMTLIVKHHIVLRLDVKHKFLSNGSILFILQATLLIDGKPFKNQLIRFYRKGSWIYIGSNTTNSDGVATLYYVANQTSISKTYTFKAEYNSSDETIGSTTTISSENVVLPQEYWRPPPTGEPVYLPLLVLAVLLAVFIYKVMGSRVKR
jgi:5-hydroxyisourate hydrolase-like protein (transthyretin family)